MVEIVAPALLEDSDPDEPRCGLCGSTGDLTLTYCCHNWICDDEEDYVLFSFARNSCYRNHSRYTLCAYHFQEEHPGDWKSCDQCREDFDTEIYVWNGTNEYNFEKLLDPPSYEPTHCAHCGTVINLAEGGYTISPDGSHSCDDCFERIILPTMPELLADLKPKARRKSPKKG